MEHTQYETYHETKVHASPDFPYNTYLCTIPLDFNFVPVHWHDEAEIIVIKKGMGIIRVDLVPFEASAGDIVFVLPGQLHSIEQKEDFVMEYENILFKPDMLTSKGQDFCNDNFIRPLFDGMVNFPSYIDKSKDCHAEVSSCIADIDNISSDRPFGYQLLIKSYLLRIAFLLLANHSVNTHSIKRKKTLDKIKMVLSYIREHYSDIISVQDMAELCHYSQSHFMKFFKNAMGMGFTQYLNDYRLESAGKMLLATSNSILDIAMETGFDNLSYFNRMFKRKYGVTPGRYRKT